MTRSLRALLSASGSTLAAALIVCSVGQPSCATQRQVPERFDPRKTCLSEGCHPTFEKVRSLHWKGFGRPGECRKCHVSRDGGHRFETDSSAEACLECHEAIAAEIDAAEHVHPAAEDACVDCHDPHGSEAPALLVAAGRKLCADCHDDVVELVESSPTNHDVRGKECGHCHDPHTGADEMRLRKPIRMLCLDCHSRRVRSDGGRLANIGKLLSGKGMWHEPIGTDGCAKCHFSHGGKNFRLLRDAYPDRLYAGFSVGSYALCFDCHDAESVTRPRTRSLTRFRNGDRNLHYLHVNKERRGRTCRACHDIHATSNPFLVRDGFQYSPNWWMRIEFEPTASGGSCTTGCHRRVEYDRNTASPGK